MTFSDWVLKIEEEGASDITLEILKDWRKDISAREKERDELHHAWKESRERISIHLETLMKDGERMFKLHWKTGEPTLIKGFDIRDAVSKAGYGGGAFAALDYWEEVKI